MKMFSNLFVFLRAVVLTCSAWIVMNHGVCATGLDWSPGRLLPEFSPPAAELDGIDVSSASGGEVDLFASLEGIVNRQQPRIACVGRSPMDGKFTWLKLHHLNCRLIDGFEAIVKYRNEIAGLVVTDPDEPDTLNLATTLAGLNNELICTPNLLQRLTNAPYNLQVKDDLRGRFKNPDEVDEYLYEHCWPRCTHHIFAGMGKGLHGGLRDYLIAVQSAVVWLDPKKPKEKALLSRFFSGLKPAGSVYMGWWPDESAGLKFAGRFGIPVFASDFFDNGSVFSGVQQPVKAGEIPPRPRLENKIYVSFFISDGDNAQYMQHHMKENWGNPARGQVPIGWTVSPLAADLDPGMLNYYYQTATTNDCLVSGPSGAGYARLDFWQTNDLTAFAKMSDSYFRRSGLRVVTIWLRATDAIGNAFARNCPTLLGLTSQDGGSFNVFHGDLPTIGLARNYESKVQKLISTIQGKAKTWQGKTPLFIAVQADGWYITPADCRTMADALDKNTFVVVRPDHLFELDRAFHAAAQATPP